MDPARLAPRTSSAYVEGPGLGAVVGGERLTRGQSGEGVRGLQALLNRLGVQPPLAEDGLLGPKTEAALAGIQAQLGLPSTGALDGATLLAALMAAGAGATPGRTGGSTSGGAAGGVSPPSDGVEPVRRGGAAPRAPRIDAPRPDGSVPARELGRAPVPEDPRRPGGEWSSPTPVAPRPTPAAPRPSSPAPAGPAGAAPATGGGDLGAASGIPDRIIDRTARFESGRRYDAWNADDNGHGVSFGLIQFNQHVGSLPTLIGNMAERNPQRFDEIFGPYARDLRNPAYVRSANLNDPDLRARLQQAGREPEFQQVQRDLARRGYYEPAARMAERHGLTSERAHAMLFDSSVQNGVGGTERFLRQAAEGGGSEREVLERFARLADRGSDSGRRSRILRDPGFSDAPVGRTEAPRTEAPRAETPRTEAPRTETPRTEAPRTEAPAGVDAPSVAPAAGTTGARPGLAPIGPGNRVLMIGDSHTVGTYGNEMDRLLRSSGATVSSYGSSGSSPSWWMRGTTTSSGFVGRHADGTVERPADWRTPHETPRLRELIERERPDTLVVSLGGNMRGMSEDQIRRQVRELGEVARENGVRLVWAGPPSRRADAGDRGDIDRFDAIMRDAVAPYGSYVASSRYTEYSGSDGVHYSGARGTAIARQWAGAVYGEIQGTP